MSAIKRQVLVMKDSEWPHRCFRCKKTIEIEQNHCAWGFGARRGVPLTRAHFKCYDEMDKEISKMLLETSS